MAIDSYMIPLGGGGVGASIVLVTASGGNGGAGGAGGAGGNGQLSPPSKRYAPSFPTPLEISDEPAVPSEPWTGRRDLLLD